ncbi:MAG: hypothetical protein LBK52_05465, partial [Deltaproteobacteria bacterium]|nr:hypothetical protein [Deltaproteobacteria bacterium]
MTQVKPLELLFLWSLAASGSSGWLKEIKPKLEAPPRRSLKSLGLIEENYLPHPVSRARSLLVSLTESGWQFLADNMNQPLSSRSPAGTLILGQFL